MNILNIAKILKFVYSLFLESSIKFNKKIKIKRVYSSISNLMLWILLKKKKF